MHGRECDIGVDALGCKGLSVTYFFTYKEYVDGLHTNYCLLKLFLLVQVEELAGSKCKHHALVVLLQLVVDLCGY